LTEIYLCNVYSCQEILSRNGHGQYNMMDETFLVDELKKLMCFVSLDFGADMLAAQQRGSANPVRREFVSN
jgi:hypothetical protein